MSDDKYVEPTDEQKYLAAQKAHEMVEAMGSHWKSTTGLAVQVYDEALEDMPGV